MSAVPANTAQTSPKPKSAKTFSIGVVLDQLKAEFPDVTVSKIRYLESEGLISPQRTSTGYRRFTADDVSRLRYILSTQRDHYLPLKVIREQLEALDAGTMTPLRKVEAQPVISPENFHAPITTRLTDTDLADRTGVSAAKIAELRKAGVIIADHSGFFNADDVSIVATAASLEEFGFDVRHLKSLRNTATRQADLIQRAVLPTSRSKNDGREKAEEMTQEMMALVVTLHTGLLKSSLRQQNQ